MHDQELKMGLITVLIFTSALVTAYAKRCDDISGYWKNELGSRMILNVESSNRISGEFYTAVETNPGAAAFVSNITGLFSRQKDGSLLAFSVLFNHGSSLTSWVGQCTICDDKEVLYTTYTFRKYVSSHQEKWASIIVNQNTFWRSEEENDIGVAIPTRFSPIRTLSTISQKQSGGLDLTGKWESTDNEEFSISGQNGEVLEGMVTCCQHSGNFQGKRHSTELIGRKDGSDMFTALTLMSTTNKRVKSWTGYNYNTFASVPPTLEMSWLEHDFNPTCESARSMVRFGTQNFTRMTAGSANIESKSETFLDKIRKFLSNMF